MNGKVIPPCCKSINQSIGLLVKGGIKGKMKLFCFEIKAGLRGRHTKLLKFQPNRTYGFWDVAVERFFVSCFCQYIDKVKRKIGKRSSLILFLAIFYQYFMIKPSYYFYLTEFWSETFPVYSYSLKLLLKINPSCWFAYLHNPGRPYTI